jgi:hypothetical protein
MKPWKSASPASRALARAEEWLRNPPPASRAAIARDFGIDLTLLIQQLRRTPEERLEMLERVSNDLEELRAGLRGRSK